MPEISIKSNSFEVILHKKKINEPVNDSQNQLVNLLKKIRKLNRIKRIGSDKTGYWELIK